MEQSGAITLTFRRTIIAIFAPVFMLAVLIASFFENRKPSEVSSTPPGGYRDCPLQGKSRISNHEADCISSFSRLVPVSSWLVALFSTSAVVAPVNFDFIASMVTLFHFVIAKGDAEVTRLQARGVNSLDSKSGTVIPHDPDFD